MFPRGRSLMHSVTGKTVGEQSKNLQLWRVYLTYSTVIVFETKSHVEVNNGITRAWSALKQLLLKRPHRLQDQSEMYHMLVLYWIIQERNQVVVWQLYIL